MKQRFKRYEYPLKTSTKFYYDRMPVNKLVNYCGSYTIKAEFPALGLQGERLVQEFEVEIKDKAAIEPEK